MKEFKKTYWLKRKQMLDELFKLVTKRIDCFKKNNKGDTLHIKNKKYSLSYVIDTDYELDEKGVNIIWFLRPKIKSALLMWAIPIEEINIAVILKTYLEDPSLDKNLILLTICF